MTVVKDIKRGFREDFVASFSWLSVQLMGAWGVVWVIYGSLPSETLIELAKMRFWGMTVPAWMGIVQAVSLYFGRMKKPA